jgi:hypothetical protein
VTAQPAKLLKHGLGHGPALAVVAALTLTSSALGVDAFRQLNGTEIKARFSGKELTDGVHWSMRFGNGGKLTASEAVGRFAPEEKCSTRGTWRVVRDELCLDYGAGDLPSGLGVRQGRATAPGWDAARGRRLALAKLSLERMEGP